MSFTCWSSTILLASTLACSQSITGSTVSDSAQGVPVELREYLSLSPQQSTEIARVNQEYARQVQKLRSEMQDTQIKASVENSRNPNRAIEAKQLAIFDARRSAHQKVVRTLTPAQTSRLEMLERNEREENTPLRSQAATWNLLSGPEPPTGSEQFSGATPSFRSDTAAQPTDPAAAVDRKKISKRKPKVPPPQ